MQAWIFLSTIFYYCTRFEDLRIRRETKSKNLYKDGARKTDKSKSALNDKTACLLFVATLRVAKDTEIQLEALSRPIQLCKCREIIITKLMSFAPK